jgi:DNA-binding response OmpR family regulator
MKKHLAIIVEDDAKLSRIFSLAIQNDFETEVFGDGNAAFMRMGKVKPALIILDLNLPGLQGKDILANIRADKRLANTHVIICTADERQSELLHEEADIVLLKPVSPAQLRQIAARFIPQ